jgi:nitroreductase
MEFAEVLKHRRMVRHYLDQPLDPDVVDRILAAGLRAPSAGFSQGYALLALESAEDRSRFWQVTDTEQETASWPAETRAGVMRAPLVVVALSCKRAYLDRYAREDKGWADRDESRWPVPYWDVDAGFAALLMLLTAVDLGLGVLFFGVFEVDGFRQAFGVPEPYTPVGALAIGHPLPDEPSPSLARGKRALDAVVHRGRW